ncbi:MAG: ABC transporter ATP-binding protein [Planctomycetota bacterium]
MLDNKEIVVELQDVYKEYRTLFSAMKVNALNGLSLRIYRGETFGLLGPNGSGKTTTIKIILGLLHIKSGKVSVFGFPPDNADIKSKIGYMPEESYLPRYLSVEEVLYFYAGFFYRDKKIIRNKVDELIEMVELGPHRHKKIKELSKGLARRTTFAQAIINNPELLILDEPTTGLDPLSSVTIKTIIKNLKARGTTIIMCSHLLQDIEELADRLLLLYEGKVLKEGTIYDFLALENRVQLTLLCKDKNSRDKIATLLKESGVDVLEIKQPLEKLEEFFYKTFAKRQ